jgi:hypothetical protein
MIPSYSLSRFQLMFSVSADPADEPAFTVGLTLAFPVTGSWADAGIIPTTARTKAITKTLIFICPPENKLQMQLSIIL